MSVLSRDEVLDALTRDLDRYPENSPDHQELLRIRDLLLRARETGDTVHLISIEDRAHGR